MPPINNSYDLYNTTLAADQPFVDAAFTLVKSELETNVTNEVMEFDVDLAEVIDALEISQKNRVLDRVIFECRNNGIRCWVKGVAMDTNDPTFSRPNFNDLNNISNILRVEWYSRNSQEYLKTFC